MTWRDAERRVILVDAGHLGSLHSSNTSNIFTTRVIWISYYDDVVDVDTVEKGLDISGKTANNELVVNYGHVGSSWIEDGSHGVASER